MYFAVISVSGVKKSRLIVASKKLMPVVRLLLAVGIKRISLLLSSLIFSLMAASRDDHEFCIPVSLLLAHPSPVMPLNTSHSTSSEENNKTAKNSDNDRSIHP
jgi:hypothetical protein